MYLIRPPMTTSAAERLETEWNKELLSAKTGPFCVMELMPLTVTIDQYGIRNTVSVGWPKLAPKAERTANEANSTKSDDKVAERERTHAGDK